MINRNSIGSHAIAVAWAFLLIISAQSQSFCGVVCQEKYISGCHEQHAIADFYFLAKTNDPKEVKIYMEVVQRHEEEQIYIQSNYLPTGDPNSFPVKIAASVQELRGSLETVLRNILYPGVDVSGLGVDQRLEANLRTQEALRSAELYINGNFFGEGGQPRMSLDSVGKIKYVLANTYSKSSPLDLITNPSRGPPPFLVKLKDNIFVKLNSGRANISVLKDLNPIPFNKTRFKLINLIAETSVEAALNVKGIREYCKTGMPQTKEALAEMIKSSSGELLAILAHSDGSNFVVSDPSGATAFTISINEANEIAKNCGAGLFALGCSSANSQSALGVLRPFNPVLAIEAIQRALNTSNLKEFIENTAGDDLELVFDGVPFGSPIKFNLSTIDNEVNGKDKNGDTVRYSSEDGFDDDSSRNPFPAGSGIFGSLLIPSKSLATSSVSNSNSPELSSEKYEGFSTVAVLAALGVGGVFVLVFIRLRKD